MAFLVHSKAPWRRKMDVRFCLTIVRLSSSVELGIVVDMSQAKSFVASIGRANNVDSILR